MGKENAVWSLARFWIQQGQGKKSVAGRRWVAEGGTGQTGNIRRLEGSWYTHLTGFSPMTGQDTAPHPGDDSR